MNCGYNGPAKTITIISTPVVPGVISGPSLVCPNGTYTSLSLRWPVHQLITGAQTFRVQ
jgi:hypothetical protein